MARSFKLEPRSEEWIAKQMKKPGRRFAVYDVEGRNWIEHVMSGYYDGITYRWFKHVGEFASFLIEDWFERKSQIEEGNEKGVRLTIFSHFGGKYDFLFLLDYFLLSSDWQIENMIPRGSGILSFDAVYEISEDEKIIITFSDSSAMLPFGLKRLTESFGVETKKGEWDHSKTGPEATPELIEYNKADCIGLYQVIERYFNWPIIKRAGSSTTIAGQAMKVLQTTLKDPVHSLPPKIDEFVRRAYFGGRTEIFKPVFLGPGKLTCADVNSLYPTVMREPPRVDGVGHGYPTKVKCIAYDYKPGDIGFFDAEVEVPDMYVPPLGVVWSVDGGQKFIFPTGRFKGRWSTLELEYAKSVGVKVLRLGRGCLFENGGLIFSDYVNELYKIRENSPRDSVDNVLSKLLLNSCYGRFGLRLDRTNLVIDDGRRAGVSEYCLIGSGDREIRLMSEAKRLEAFTNVAVSAWVTSAARVFMHRKYMESPESLYYTDTDSIFTTASYPDEKGLGGLKREYDCESACFLLPKTYIASHVDGTEKNKVTMKGFSRGRDGKKLAHFQMEDFLTALEGDLRLMRVTEAEKMATFKTALSKGKILSMLDERPKAIQSMYDKRVVEKIGNRRYDTRPHRIKDGEAIWYLAKNPELTGVIP